MRREREERSDPGECDLPVPGPQPTECPESMKSSLPPEVQKAQGVQQILNQGAAATASATAMPRMFV